MRWFTVTFYSGCPDLNIAAACLELTAHCAWRLGLGRCPYRRSSF
jgi:hypothetical protein